MGTINYKTSDYITLGINPDHVWSFKEDPEIMQELADNIKPYGGSLENEVLYYADDIFSDLYNDAEAILNNYDFYYYHVVLESGYYEGFSLNIENNFPVFFDDYMERAEALKEITQIKKLMLDLVEAGLVACYPGWCTGYADYKETKKEVNQAIKEMRTEARFTPTYNQYKKEAC